MCRGRWEDWPPAAHFRAAGPLDPGHRPPAGPTSSPAPNVPPTEPRGPARAVAPAAPGASVTAECHRVLGGAAVQLVHPSSGSLSSASAATVSKGSARSSRRLLIPRRPSPACGVHRPWGGTPCPAGVTVILAPARGRGCGGGPALGPGSFPQVALSSHRVSGSLQERCLVSLRPPEGASQREAGGLGGAWAGGAPGWGGRTEATEPYAKIGRAQGAWCRPSWGEGASRGACPQSPRDAGRLSSQKLQGPHWTWARGCWRPGVGGTAGSEGRPPAREPPEFPRDEEPPPQYPHLLLSS